MMAFSARNMVFSPPLPCCREKHSTEYCAMYDICGERSDGKVLHCPYGTPAVKWNYAYEVSWGSCALLGKIRKFWGLLFPNVSGIGSHRFSWMGSYFDW